MILSTFIDRLYSVNYTNFIAINVMNQVNRHFSLVNSKSTASPSLNSALSVPQTNVTASSSTSSLVTSVDLEESVSSRSSSVNLQSSKQLFEPSNSSPDKDNFFSNLAKFIRNDKIVKTSALLGENLCQPSNLTYHSDTIFVASHLCSQNAEHTLIRSLALFLVETLLKNTNLEDCQQLVNSMPLKTMFADCLAFCFQSIINLLSDPSFINYQIIKIIKKYIIIENLVSNEKFDAQSQFTQQKTDLNLDAVSSNSVSHRSSLNDIRLCIGEHNFGKLYELIDQCEDTDFLNNVRFYLIGEILDAAVINYLNKGNRKISNKLLKSNSLVSSQAKLLEHLSDSSNMHAMAKNHVLMNSDKQSFQYSNFNANLNTKVKQLRSKDLNRYMNQLQYAKTICEQKLHLYKRNAASLLESSTSCPDSPAFTNSFRESQSVLELSDLVKSFNESQKSNNSLMFSPLGSGSFKSKNKRIFKFNIIIANHYSREYLKNFLQNSLFNRESRSSLSKYHKDAFICNCATYLVEFWEAIQNIFGLVVNHYEKSSSKLLDHSTETLSAIERNHDSDLAVLLSECYVILLQIVADSRFNYTFSHNFLQLPNNLLQELENLLLGDLNIIDFNQSYNDFTLESFCQPVLFDEVRILNCLNKLNLPKYLNTLIVLEKIIFDCLMEEFYPQFLISSEYDQMLYGHVTIDHAHEDPRIDINAVPYSAKWTNMAHHFELCHSKQTQFLMDSAKTLSKVIIDNDQVDILKNRAILLSFLEFPFFVLLCLQFICRHRLTFKVFIKNVITRNNDFNLNENHRKFYLDVGQVVNRDMVYYHDICMRLDRTVNNVFCWLHSSFQCKITDVYFKPVTNSVSSSSKSVDQRLMSLVETLYNDGTSNPSGQNSNGSAQLHFCIEISIDLSKDAVLLCQSKTYADLARVWYAKWTTEQSFDELVHLYSNTILSSHSIVNYLHTHSMHNYLHVLFSMISAHYPPTMSKPPSLKSNSSYDDSLKTLKLNMIEVKRLVRCIVREKQQLLKNRKKYDKLSFKDLLNNRNDESTSSEPFPSEQNDLADLKSMSLFQCQLNNFINQITSNPSLTQLTGFSNFFKFKKKNGPKFEQGGASPLISSSESCFRCQLNEHLIENNCHELSRFVMESLCLIAPNDIELLELFKPKSSPTKPMANLNGLDASGGNTDKTDSMNLFGKLQNSISITNRLIQGPDLPIIEEPYKSEKLFLLHAQSWLSGRSPTEIVDFVFHSFRYFEKFCSNCKIALSASNIAKTAKGKSTKRTFKTKQSPFRLLRINPLDDDRESSATSGTGSKSMFLSNVNHEPSTTSSSSLLQQQVESNLFDMFPIEKIDLISTSLDDSDLVEPLFQLLIDVFELKGTMTRTLRRTLVLAFQLVFGQAMLSKQLKTFLQSLMTDSSIMFYLSFVKEYLESAHKIGDNSKSIRSSTNHTDLDEVTLVEETDDYQTDRTLLVNDGCEDVLDSKMNQIDSYLKDIGELLQGVEVPTQLYEDECFMQPKIEFSTMNVVQPELDNDGSSSTLGGISKYDSERVLNRLDHETQLKYRRLQILAKQLLFASVPTFLNHMFGTQNTLIGLNKCFDVLQNTQLNKQLIHVSPLDIHVGQLIQYLCSPNRN